MKSFNVEGKIQHSLLKVFCKNGDDGDDIDGDDDDDDDGGGISLNSLLKVANQPLPNLHHLVKSADL